ncbi:MAG: PD-(D/E)XK nuclease family protein [Campylobacterota bacterium]
MLSKQKLYVFPTSRAIRNFLEEKKGENSLLPFTLTIDEFFKKSTYVPNRKYCDEEQKFLLLNEAIKDVDIKRLGISNTFSSFLKQHEYIYRFFIELSSEKVDIDSIKNIDTYDYYSEHLDILNQIRINYLNILDKKEYVDKINFSHFYKINRTFLDKFSQIELVFEGYFTKVEFDIIDEISNYKDMIIKFVSNEYNQKSLEVFKNFFPEKIELNKNYTFDLTNKVILNKEEHINENISFNIKAFSTRTNQIAFIKKSIQECVQMGVNPSNIAVVLPDEKFAQMIELYDYENYFNFAMGKSIKNSKLYQSIKAITAYINEKELKNIKTLEFFKIDKNRVDEFIIKSLNKKCTKEIFDSIIDYFKEFETNGELLEKYDEMVYKLKNLIFSLDTNLTVKEFMKVFTQKIENISLDDVNSGKITVLGLLETRANRFDAVIICDFNEEFIPKASIKDKFLSTKIKELTNLPTSKDRQLLQKYYYKKLIESSKHLFISFVKSDSSTISRFAAELFNIKDIDTNVYDEQYKEILYYNHKLKHFNEDIVEKIDLLNFTWSASALKTYLQCKRSFYLNYILKIKEHEVSLKPKPYELGSIIHKILEEYYKQDINSYDKLNELFVKYRSENPFLTLQLEIWKQKLKEFYEYEKHRLSNIKIMKLEEKFNLDFDGFKLTGVIDRIDFNTSTKKYEVIDYKTSSNLKVDSLRNYDKAVDFQLEFYYLATSELYNSSNIDVYYYDLYNTKLIEELACDKKLELLVSKLDEIKKLSNSYINFEKTQHKSICNFCAYKTICNRQ